MRYAIHLTFSSLQEDEEGLTEIFKARLGTDGLAGINQVSVVNFKIRSCLDVWRSPDR